MADMRPLNVQIAEALGWNVWEHSRRTGEWWMHRVCVNRPGMCEMRPIPDYVGFLRTSADATIRNKGNVLIRSMAEAAKMGLQ